MRLLDAIALALVALAATTLGIAVARIAGADDFGAAFWAAAGALSLRSALRMSAPPTAVARRTPRASGKAPAKGLA